VSTFSDNDWLRLLSGLGVRPTTAAEWAAPFADEIQPEGFSDGMDDLRAFVPQVLHEFAMLEKLEECLSYTPERICAVWPTRFPTLASAIPYSHAPAKLANCVYANRMGNGDTASGDGWTYRGRPMLTGRATYARIGDLIGQDLIGLPDLIQQPHYALIAARAWWESTVPDACLSDQAKIRRRVQGGTLGLDHCIALYDKLGELLA
jgi:putative chitinase